MVVLDKTATNNKAIYGTTPVMAGVTRMYMKILIFPLLLLLSFNSYSEEFDSFFSSFKSDACFALKRTSYPLKMVTYDRNGIESDETPSEKIMLINKPNSKTCGIDLLSYSAKMNLVISNPRYEKESAMVRLYTTDSGFDWDYVFKREGDEWYFTEMVSHSF